MQRKLLFKIAMVVFMTLVLLIPLSMINGLVGERQAYRDEAVRSVAASYAGPQTLVGPVLIVPYETETRVVEKEKESGKDKEYSQFTPGLLRFYPKQMNVRGTMSPGERYLGLHRVRVYRLQGQISGRFEAALPKEEVSPQAQQKNVKRRYGTPYLSFGISDVRGLVGTPSLKIDGKEARFTQGAGDLATSGLHVDLPPPGETGTAYLPGDEIAFDFSTVLELGGTETLAIAPVGDSNDIKIDSSWPHPHFTGRFLPHQRTVRDNGFDAQWNISALAAATQNEIGGGRVVLNGAVQYYDPDRAAYQNGRGYPLTDVLAVEMVDPVNPYSQADRAIKYGILFVLLTFVGFFMFETIKRLPIHPIQYFLVGLGLAVFFLLLLSLSEHISFVYAYLCASVACIGLIGFYLCAVLKSRVRGLGFAALLTLLYGTLYGLLIAEDSALVLGSLLLFVVLAAVMVITRRIDWYAVSIGLPGAAKPEK